MLKNKKVKKEEQDKLDYKEIREYKPITNKIGFYVCLISGLIILFMGIFLWITNSIGTGFTISNRYGNGGGKPAMISGPGTVFLGIIALLFANEIRRIDKKRKG